MKEAKTIAQNAERESIIQKIEADLYNEKVKTGEVPSKEKLKEIISKNYGKIDKDGENEIDSFTSNKGEYKINFQEIEGWEIKNKELKYLESTGTQWIDTEFISNQDSGYEIKFSVLDADADTVGIYGARVSSTNNNFSIGAWKLNNCIFTDYNDYQSGRTTIKYDNDIHVFKANKNEIIMDGKKSSTNNYTSFTPGKTNYVFKINGGLSNSKLRVYYLKIYDNNKLVRDFIPTLKEEQIPCFYDKVEKEYYYNKGTGEFSYGE